MPMYDFYCTACSQNFEEMTSTTEDCPTCPFCGNTTTERQLSAPNLKTGAMPFKVGPVRPIPPMPKRGGPCNGNGCGGSCSR